MTKIALIADTHWGIRGDNKVFHDYMDQFLEGTFFPRLEQEGIDTIIHLGDLVDKRKQISFSTSYRLKNDFLEKLKNYKVHIVVGNHDTVYKNTNYFNVYRELNIPSLYNIKVYEDPEEILIDDTKLLMLPWICSGNREASMEVVRSSNSSIICSHLELKGFEYDRGNFAKDGDDPGIFNKFEFVFSGHYHTKSNRDNIYYLGAPCEFTWADYNEEKGFHIFDLATKELEFVQNKRRMFKKIFYNDKGKTLEDLIGNGLEQYVDSYIKIIVRHKENPLLLETFATEIQKLGVHDLAIVEDNYLEVTEETNEELDIEDTKTIIRKYIDSLEIKNRDKVLAHLDDLYKIANEIS